MILYYVELCLFDNEGFVDTLMFWICRVKVIVFKKDKIRPMG